MTRPSDRLAWALAIGLLACVALMGALIVERGRDEAHRPPAPGTQFFAVALA